MFVIGSDTTHPDLFAYKYVIVQYIMHYVIKNITQRSFYLFICLNR